MSKTIENLFYYLATFVPLLPFLTFVAFALLFKSTRKNLVLQTIAVYAAVEFATNFSALAATMKVVVVLYAIFTALEYTLFARTFYLVINNKVVKRGIVYLSIGFIIFWLLYLYFGPKNELDSVPIGVESILILMYACYFLFEEMDNVWEGPIYFRYRFWITAGILVYLSGNFFLYVLSNQVDERTRHVFWMFGNLCAILKNVSFVISIITFWKKRHLNKSLKTGFSLV